MEIQKEVIIYTDGACSGNPGPGGWGAVLMYGTRKKELSGGAAETTNNRMEMTAVITALETLNRPCRVTLYSDSQYIVDMINGGNVARWKANGWSLSRKKISPAKNIDLWEKILTQMERHEITFIWVKGHAANAMNNRCDELAVAACAKYRKP